MPVSLERRLKKAAKKKFGSTTSKTARRYIWGGMRNAGWVPEREKRK